MAPVPKAVSLLSPVSDLSLPDVSHGVCEFDGAADRVADRTVCDRATARVSNWAVYPRGGAAEPSEEERHTDDGRGADLHLDPGADAAVERSFEPVCVDRDAVDAGVWGDRVCGRLHQGGA